jgi:hypothetical protein
MPVCPAVPRRGPDAGDTHKIQGLTKQDMDSKMHPESSKSIYVTGWTGYKFKTSPFPPCLGEALRREILVIIIGY